MEKEESTLTKQNNHAILESIEKCSTFEESKDLYYSLYPPAWGGVLGY